MGDKNRNYLLDNVKVLLIGLVVLGHALKNIDTNIASRSLYIFIYIFHMPLFVFISGYFSKDVDKCRKNAVKDLLIPFIVFNIIWYASVGDFTFPLYIPGWTLWYLLSLFIWRLLLKDLIRIKWMLGLSIVLGLLVGMVDPSLDQYSSILSFSRTVAFLPFFLLGYYSNNSTIHKVRGYPKVISVLGLMSLGVLCFSIAKSNGLNIQLLYMSQSYQSLGLGLGQGTLLRIIGYLLAIVVSGFVFNLVPSRKFKISKIGANTMVIYLGHGYIIKFLNGFGLSFNSALANFLTSLVISVLICALLSLPIFGTVYSLVFGKFNSVLVGLYGKAKSITTNM